MGELISKKPGVMGGVACIAGTRISVACIAVGWAGVDDETILQNYPVLTIEQVEAARAYAAAHPNEMRDERESEEDELERLRSELDRARAAESRLEAELVSCGEAIAGIYASGEAVVRERDDLRSDLAAWLATCRRCEQHGCPNRATRVCTGEFSPLGEVTIELCDSCLPGAHGTDKPQAELVRKAGR